MQLRITNLSKRYENGVLAMDQITLELGTGMFGLLGPNGAGKSTLMRTIATLQLPDEGSILLNDLDVLNSPVELKKRLGYLPQEFGVYPGISALRLLEHIAFMKGITNKNERKEAAAYLLAKVNLFDVRKRYVSTFSGGMKQRFGIAQALIGQPKLLIVDEPTAGLDPNERIRFNNLLGELSTDMIVILSTHIVEDVSDLCQDMAIMNHGKIILRGNPGQLIKTLKGKVYGSFQQKELIQKEEKYHILYSHLSEGKPFHRIYSEGETEEAFEPVAPRLADIYFKNIQ